MTAPLGGAGLCRQAFERAEDLLRYTFKAIDTCPCESGCPACVHSPKCGSGNRPIDKTAARYILKAMIANQSSTVISNRAAADTPENVLSDDGTSKIPQPPKRRARAPVSLPEEQASTVRRPRFRQRRRRRRVRDPKPDASMATNRMEVKSPEGRTNKSRALHYGVFDIETQRSAQEVGGWHRADLMRISCAVVYDSQTDEYHTYTEPQVAEMIDALGQFELVIGFNIKRFDYNVLSGYSDQDFGRLPTLDLLEEIHKRLGYRLSLDHLARVTLGRQKTADGLQALRWWKQGRIDEIIAYCRQDVKITKDLFEYGQANKYLLFNNKAGSTVRVPVAW